MHMCAFLGVSPPFFFFLLVLSVGSSDVLAVCAVCSWQIIKLPRHRPRTRQNNTQGKLSKVRNCLSFVSL